MSREERDLFEVRILEEPELQTAVETAQAVLATEREVHRRRRWLWAAGGAVAALVACLAFPLVHKSGNDHASTIQIYTVGMTRGGRTPNLVIKRDTTVSTYALKLDLGVAEDPNYNVYLSVPGSELRRRVGTNLEVQDRTYVNLLLPNELDPATYILSVETDDRVVARYRVLLE